jgi:uncharacterized membrane protein YhaH (DUF805 family)
MSGWLRVSGRISRQQFWQGYVWPLAALFILGAMLDEALFTAGMAMPDPDGGLVTSFAALIGLIGMVAAFVRRLHDIGVSGGWVVLIVGIPAVGPLLAVLLLGILPGAAGSNRFGPRPPD